LPTPLPLARGSTIRQRKSTGRSTSSSAVREPDPIVDLLPSLAAGRWIGQCQIPSPDSARNVWPAC
jgi:hypothetical protein